MLKIFIPSIAAFFSFAAAQSGYLGGTLLFDNTTCVTGPNTTFTSCNGFYSTLGNCTSNTTSASLVACECTQSFFNLILDCKNELRICTGNNTWDATLDPLIETWHSVCDSASGLKPTTPVLSSTRGGSSAQTSAIIFSAASTGTPTGASSGAATGSSSSAISTAASGSADQLLLPSGITFNLVVIPIMLLAVVL